MMRKTLIATGMVVIGLSSSAASYYLNVDESSKDQGAFTNATCWVDEQGQKMTAWDTEGTYYVLQTNTADKSSKYRMLRTPAVEGAVTFPGGKLVLWGASGGKQNGLLLQTTGAGAKIPGGVVLKAYSYIGSVSSGGAGTAPGTAANPFVLDADIDDTMGDGGSVPQFGAYASHRAILVKGKITKSYEWTASLMFDPAKSERGDMTVGFADGTLSGYPGQFDILARDFPSDCRESIRLVFGTDDCDGKFYPHHGNMYPTNEVHVTFAVRTCDDVFKIKQFGVNHTGAKPSGSANFSLANGMAFEFAADGAQRKCGQFIVKDTLLASGQTVSNLVIRLVGNACHATETNRFATLSVPKAKALDRAILKLECPDTYPWVTPVLSVEDNGSYSTIYVTVPPSGDVVRMVKSDSSTHDGQPKYTSAFLTPESWSNEKVPETGHVYLMEGNLSDTLMVARTPNEAGHATGVSYDFPSNTTLCLWKQARIQTQKTSVTFDDLRSYEGVLDENMAWGSKRTTGLYKLTGGAATTVVNGNVTVVSGYFSFGCINGLTMEIAAKLHGSGTVAFSGMFVTEYDLGNYKLTAVNDDFYGKMTTLTSYRSSTMPAYEKCPKLWIGDGRALGADLAEPTADAFVLTDYTRLMASSSFTVAAKSNRGITVRKTAVIQADEGLSIRIETPLTVDGTLYKEGAGVLTLAGAATSASGTDKLVVTNGTLQLAGERAVAGLAVTLAVGTQLAVEPGIGEKGVDLTTTSLTLDASFGGKLPLVADADAGERELFEGDVALFTVNTSDKTAFQAMLPSVPPKFCAHSKSGWNDPVDNGDGTTTFSANVFKPGFSVIIR